VSPWQIVAALAAASGLALDVIAHRLMGDWQPTAEFYRQLFGWSDARHMISGGTFRTLGHGGHAFASLYRIAREQVERGVPAHWIPYVSTPDVSATAAKATSLAGRIVVQPQHFPGLARVCLIADPTGAILGLWQGEGPRHLAGV